MSIWRPLCVKVKSDRTHLVVLLHVFQFHPSPQSLQIGKKAKKQTKKRKVERGEKGERKGGEKGRGEKGEGGGREGRKG